MKTLFLFLIIVSAALSQETDKSKFIGKWTGEDKGEIGYIMFEEDGSASFEIQGQILGGRDFILKGKKCRMTYEINTHVNPIEVDFVLIALETNEQKRLLCIAKLIDENAMRFASNFDNQRPASFDAENSMILKRVGVK